jgi:hypothetical protein
VAATGKGRDRQRAQMRLLRHFGKQLLRGAAITGLGAVGEAGEADGAVGDDAVPLLVTWSSDRKPDVSCPAWVRMNTPSAPLLPNPSIRPLFTTTSRSPGLRTARAPRQDC